MRIGIDLLWVRVGICGGTESVIRNLLDGFVRYAPEQKYVLFTARDNAGSFQHYAAHACVDMHICPVECAGRIKRIAWENLYLDKEAQKEKIDVMFIPVYSKPMTHGSGIPYIAVIHDLQALHYPQYFSFVKRLFLKQEWKHTCRTAACVITISDYCREDLVSRYPFVKDKLVTIYDPVVSRESGLDPAEVEEKYGIEREKYFYCVSSLLPHKNLDTILRVMQMRRERGETAEKLVLSGVGGNLEGFRGRLRMLGIEELVVLTGFVSDEERDCLYENCRLFLFPSIFEGFGMPPIEAMRKGKRVVMTRESCLGEITEGKAVYVDSPMDADEWLQKIAYAQKLPQQVEKFEKYDLENVTRRYVEVMRNI